jgi:hypothetical protein
MPLERDQFWCLSRKQPLRTTIADAGGAVNVSRSLSSVGLLKTPFDHSSSCSGAGVAHSLIVLLRLRRNILAQGRGPTFASCCSLTARSWLSPILLARYCQTLAIGGSSREIVHTSAGLSFPFLSSRRTRSPMANLRASIACLQKESHRAAHMAPPIAARWRRSRFGAMHLANRQSGSRERPSASWRQAEQTRAIRHYETVDDHAHGPKRHRNRPFPRQTLTTTQFSGDGRRRPIPCRRSSTP